MSSLPATPFHQQPSAALAVQSGSEGDRLPGNTILIGQTGTGKTKLLCSLLPPPHHGGTRGAVAPAKAQGPSNRAERRAAARTRRPVSKRGPKHV